MLATTNHNDPAGDVQPDYRPIRAKRLLAELGKRQMDLAAHVVLTSGRHPSNSTITHLLRGNVWPARTPRVFLRRQIAEYLRHAGATEEEIAVAFEIDDENPGPMRPIRQDSAHPGRGSAPIAEVDMDQLPEKAMLTQMARRHFGLFRDPFLDDVQGTEDVFLAPEQRYIREHMFSTAKHGGFLAVIGESGAGKSVLRRDLIDRIQREEHAITPIMPRTIDKGQLTASALCDAIIEDISQEKPKQKLESKARQIERLLTGSSRGGNSHVLIIEEAHDLTVPTLKYLKRFWELEDGFRRLIAIILIGQPELRGTLDERRNWQAREVIRRIEVAELTPLDGHLEGYLAMKLKRLGKEAGEVFEEDAYDAMRERLTLQSRSSREAISMLYPLVVNNFTVKCMNLAAELGQRKVNADVVKGA
ncbi:ExeA family protein [Halomonas saccharevitans]|uniref:Type II secretory pathway, component ExeA (Predicted ATPase) n=1 Tax=Halomonas saccharevitans TaxID=416872 RepID=A0A1I7CKT0_9GAMM|nr:AAA family ATPase [Halomonas saccharevitans]SFU00026.1 Type II secretory pathway, component ExeA (predicted ATPase) [Halomonas saccharevitans]